MKTFNLIKWLWTDSHEKQSPQRLRRYAVMLLMLLTLGVGQMWADAIYYYRGNQNSWGATALSVSDDGFYEYFSAKGYSNNGNANQVFKISLSDSSWDYDKTYKSSGFNGTNITNMGDWDSDNICIYNSSNYYILVYYPNTIINTTSKPIVCASTSKPEQTSLKIKHTWDGSSWTWQTMSRTGQGTYTYTGNFYTANGANVWTSTSDNNYISSIGGKTGVNNGVPAVWTYNSTANTLSVAPAYTLTVNTNNASYGTASGSVSKGIKMSTKYAISASNETGYHFVNWTRVSGGTCTFDNSSSASTNVTVTGDASATIRANFAEDTYTVTVNNDGGGSTNKSGAQTVGVVTGIALSVTPNDGKEFAAWEIVSGTGTFASSLSTASNTFYPTSAATIRATFRSNRALTVVAGTHVTTVSGSVDPATLSTVDYTISATAFETGYEFYNWTAVPAANANIASSTSATTTTKVLNGSVTITANAKETMRTITISGGTVYGGVATSTTAGVATSAKITANAPAAGKKFTGWSLGSGVSLKAGYALTDRTIEIYSTKTATVTANYADRAQVKMYFAKPTTLSWGTLYAYAWQNSNTSNKNATYPGIEISTTETINHVVYYVYQYYTEGDGIGGSATGQSTWDRVIFGCNNDSKKTGDLTISNGHYYFKSSTGTGKTAALTSAWCIKGSFNSWSEDADQITHSAAATGSKSITLTTGNKTFKIYNIVNETWWRFSGNVTATKAATAMDNSDGDMTLTPTIAGNYTFALASLTGTPTLAITYPTAYQLNYSIGTVAGTSGTISTSPSTSSGSYVASGNTVTLTGPAAKSGYTWKGWYTNAAGTTGKIDDDSRAITVTMNATKTLYACYNYATYTATLSTTDRTGYDSGAPANQTATYLQNMPTITPPTAANGYCFMGYWDDEEGEGTQYYNADGTSAHAWDKTSGATLYAYFKKAEITELTLSSAIVAPNTSITVTPTISPTPTGTTQVCYEIQYSNGTALSPQPSMSVSSNVLTFTAPLASATYRIQATLETGSGACGSGTELSTYSTTFQVAGSHTVTVRYQDSDGRTIKASTEVTARPLAWTTDGDITPPTITGYTFVRWDAGDGVSIKNGDSDPVTTTTTASIQIKANYDGTLTAVYNKKNMIYFYNTLGWSDVYVYFYNSDEYWSGDYGSGAKQTQAFNGDHKPYWEQEHGHMTQIEGTNIWYFDYTAAGYSTRANVVFTEDNKHDTQWFWKTKAVRRRDHKSSLPMYVPINAKTTTKNETDYYNEGYWMNYPENTGYWLKIYNAWNVAKETGAVRTIAIPFSEDKTLPLKLDVEFNDANNHEYWFMVYRNDGTYLGNLSTFNQNSNSEQSITGGDNKSRLVTSAPGYYTFTLSYHDENYYIDVDFPIATGDYRIVYTDNATWSKGAHGASWNHPSDVIVKIDNEATEAKEDIVSFYISKGAGITNTMKFQYASSINASTGAVTWTDVPSGTIDLSDYSSVITKAGVYNFHITQPVGGESISVEKVEPYTGNYYIRTDCAGSTKWDSYKTLDHQMTYSDYAEKNSGFTHYYAHWVTTGQNVKFCIANDYSPCISDTIAEDYGTTIANITAEGNSGAGTLNSGNANIRFMWNQATNKISRAYISGSSNISDRFLVLEGDAKMYDSNGNALSISGLNANEINLVDDQNFVYEQTIQVNTSARAKLTAKYNNNIQYFRGSAGAFAEETTVELLGGSASGKHKMRIVYDFKTNRLVTAYLPSGTIDESMAINADLMIVREHQEAGEQITFSGSGALSDVHTVYGVMRFNRWTLNNKEKTGGHSPVGDPKSVYERSLYWISFPFDVNLSDVFGFGTYGVDWIIEYYDGAERATNGYWKDSPGFWKMVMPAQRASYLLEAGKGYVLAIDIDRMKDNNTDFWTNNIEQVELFFPSATNTVGAIAATNVTTSADEHTCTIDRRTDKSSPDINKDRTKADSHWNMIGVPSYANYGTTIKDGKEGSTITWRNDPTVAALPYLYEWNMVDDSYTVQSGTTYPFKAMHSYMVQYYGNLYWSLASATPSSIVARRTYDEAPQNAEFRLELQQNEKMVDQTFVKLSNDEQVSADFVFDEDLCKEYNGSKANIYTFIENYIPAAGNTLPMNEQTTIVPVGVKITATGDYTFAIPDGTSGIGVTLIDTENNIRTSLSALSYTVNLTAGTHDGRFLLEIAPIQQTPTDIDLINGENGENGVRKMLIDQQMYIIRDGKIYDARGARVQ